MQTGQCDSALRWSVNSSAATVRSNYRMVKGTDLMHFGNVLLLAIAQGQPELCKHHSVEA